MRILPYWLYRVVADRLVGKFLVYAHKREAERGNLHEAEHIAAAVYAGDSTPCRNGAPCTLTASHPPVWSPDE